MGQTTRHTPTPARLDVLEWMWAVGESVLVVEIVSVSKSSNLSVGLMVRHTPTLARLDVLEWM